jgi:2-enoate reductase
MMDDLIVTKGVCLANTSFLRDFFEANKVPVYLETSVKDIKDGAVTVADKDGNTFEISADSVILSVGYKSKPLAPKSKKVHIVGDANKVGNLRTVIWGAWDACMKIRQEELYDGNVSDTRAAGHSQWRKRRDHGQGHENSGHVR